MTAWNSVAWVDEMPASDEYGCSLAELRALMELRGSEALEKDITLVILLISAIVSLALSFYKPPEGGGGQYYIYFSLLEARVLCLQSKIETEHKFSVIRGGHAVNIVVNELVVGDVARVKYGR
uniref:Cation_ATPase_N domain-containing protein n=1 Tax=Heterorhabditis bacteriophora TaxID=37862 RepID=A0A1I7W7W3_HETBA